MRKESSIVCLIGFFSCWLPSVSLQAQEISNLEKENELRHDSIEWAGQELKLVFQDDFENGSDKWQTTDDTAWRFTTSHSGTCFGLKQRISNYHPKFRSPHNIALIKGKSFKDFVIDFDVKSTKNTGNHRDCCVFFCYQNAEQFYYVHLGAKPDAASGQVMIVNAAPRKPMTENKKPIAWTDGWHKVRVVFHATTGKVDVYFDDLDKPLMSNTNKVFSSGQIGIGSFDDMNDFDNVRVYSHR